MFIAVTFATIERGWVIINIEKAPLHNQNNNKELKLHATMDCLALLSNVLAEISAEIGVEIQLLFEPFESTKILPRTLEKFSILKSALLQVCESSQHEMVTNDGLQCQICGKKFAHPKILEFHAKAFHSGHNFLKEETSVSIFCCMNCNKCFASKLEFSSHENCDVKICLPKNLQNLHSKFSCGCCSENFKSFARIKFHLDQQICKGKFSCRYCQQIFCSNIKFSLHLSTAHDVVPKFQCKICNSNFKLNTSLQKHLINKHENVSDSSYQCDQCPKKFVKKVYLTHHKTRFHNLQKQLLCSICGEMFLTPGSLQIHIKSHGENPQKYPCEICQKVFTKKEKVRNNLKSRSIDQDQQLNLQITNYFIFFSFKIMRQYTLA